MRTPPPATHSVCPFVHMVIEQDVEAPDSLQDVPAFLAFVADIADRCDVPPVATGASVVGGYA